MRRFLVIASTLALTVAVLVAAIAVSESQQANTQTTAASDVDVTITVAEGTAIAVVVVGEYQTGRTIDTPTDGTNTYTAAGSATYCHANFGCMRWFVDCDVPAGTYAIDSGTSANMDTLFIMAVELTDVADASCLDTPSGGSGTGTQQEVTAASGANNMAFTSFTPSEDNTIVLGVYSAPSTTDWTGVTPGSGYTLLGSVASPNGPEWGANVAVQYSVQTTATATTAPMTAGNLGGTSWGGTAVVLKQAAGGGGGNPPCVVGGGLLRPGCPGELR